MYFCITDHAESLLQCIWILLVLINYNNYNTTYFQEHKTVLWVNSKALTTIYDSEVVSLGEIHNKGSKRRERERGGKKPN